MRREIVSHSRATGRARAPLRPELGIAV